VYTGSFTPTSLPTYCHTALIVEETYLAGTSTQTNTYTTTPRVTTTIFTPDTSIKYVHDGTTTVTVTGSDYTYTDAISTTTVGTTCTSTSYTATASTTTTQAAKCAPTNLITGLLSVGNAQGLDGIRYSGSEVANKDASSCCQACVESECVAMDFTPGYGCTLSRGECGKSIQVTYGFTYGEGFSAQAGCGSVELSG
jgi:hypothetical protein